MSDFENVIVGRLKRGWTITIRPAAIKEAWADVVRACAFYFQWLTDLREIQLLTCDGDLACHTFRYIVGLQGSSLRQSSLQLASAIQRFGDESTSIWARHSFDEGICRNRCCLELSYVNRDQRTRA